MKKLIRLRDIGVWAGVSTSPLATGKEFSWQRPQEEPSRPAIDPAKMRELETRAIREMGDTPRQGGGSPYPSSGIQTRTLANTKLWDGGSGGGGTPPPQGTRAGTPDLDRHFIHYTVMRDFPDIVFDDINQWQRFAKAPHELQREIERTLLKREGYIKDKETLQMALQKAREERDNASVRKLENKLKHRNLMIPATEEELKVAFFFGPEMESFDRNNPGGKRPKFRTDAETADFMVEVTIGRSKRPAQLNDYVYANDKERHLIMHAPHMEANWAQQAVFKRGFKLSRSYDELFDIVETIKRGPRI